MYKYSKSVVEILFTNAEEFAFLFIWYCKRPDFDDFVLHKCRSGNKEVENNSEERIRERAAGI